MSFISIYISTNNILFFLIQTLNKTRPESQRAIKIRPISAFSWKAPLLKSVSPEGLIPVDPPLDPPIVVDGVVVPPVGVAVGVEVEVFVVLEKENQERMR